MKLYIKSISFLSILLFSILLLPVNTLKAQNSTPFRNIRVEELTDDQIINFINETQRLGLSDTDAEELAIERGMSPVEAVKLKERMKLLAPPAENKQPEKKQNLRAERETDDSIERLEKTPVNNYNSAFDELVTKNFGFDIFNNPRLTFEPNLRMPTPANYTLGAGDEVEIDISGMSRANYKLTVTPEGILRIPQSGAVRVGGMSIDAATTKIRSFLISNGYAAIRTGQTRVNITLGSSVRSIRVVVIGEATMPGTYTLPSLSSAFTALYACGGANRNGSLRDIQVIRNSQVISEIDVYDYLLYGSKANDVRLTDHDVIKINTYTTRVEVKGEVKRSGYFDVKPNESLGKVIHEFAGGYTDQAYTARISVYKNTRRDRQIATITEEGLAQTFPQSGDTYVVNKILNRFSNRISIKGAIYRPGEYELKEGMSLKDVIAEADGIREDVFTNRGVIHRLNDDLSPALISFNVDSIVKGYQNIILKKDDRINLFSKFDLKDGYYVSIDGEISQPGTFLYEKGMTIEDIIVMAGGLKESSSVSRVEVSRRMKDADPMQKNTKTAIIFKEDINTSLDGNTQVNNFQLEPFDQVTVRPAPGYFIQKNAFIDGEVLYTGKYTIESKMERISDLVKRAGGLTPDAYPDGAVLIRSKRLSNTTQADNYHTGMKKLARENVEAGVQLDVLKDQIMADIKQQAQPVGIDLEKILRNPGSKYDLLLNDGDTLRIPRLLQTVNVTGEVLSPSLVRYERGMSFKNYINNSGGFGDRASKRRAYTVHPNGLTEGTRSFLFFKNYPSIYPGDQIFVPEKRAKERLRAGEVVTIGVTLLTVIAILVNSLLK